MEEPQSPSPIATRLRKLPGQLLLALINATALLVIVAAILVIAAWSSLNNAAADLARTATEAVIAEIDIEPARLLNSMQELDAEIREFRTSVSEDREERSRQLEQKIDTLSQTLASLDATLTNARVQLADEAIRQVGDSITEGLLRLRNCEIDSTAAGVLHPIGELPFLPG
ncbi:MAG: hypothetical protein GY798_35145 [Hyphomicrobiales bacterium]|nr:hypothetical protein [Hyphomicrobiales bacterium]